MGRFFARICFALLLLAFAVLLAGGLVYWRTGDPFYGLREDLHRAAWSRFDTQISKIARRQGVDPYLIKGLVWRESRFGASKVGSAGERGLMQITERAAADYTTARGLPPYPADELFRPAINLEVGTWYLKRALDHYKSKDHPVSFALTEYNAGRTRVMRWGGAKEDSETSAAEMKEKSFESTRAYVESIENRAEFYRQRGGL